jgi:hypothetical protein
VAARTPYAVGALTALAVASAALLVTLAGRPAGEPPQPVRSPEPGPAAVLAQWDATRAEAWAAGDVAALGRLYTGTSSAGRRDTAMLRRYLARGLRVDGLRTQRLAVTEVSRRSDLWVLRVRDRIAGGDVVGREIRVRLPHDRVSRHLVTLHRVGGEWRVAEVVPVRPGRPR